MKILLIGVSGAGKDTQADILKDKFGFEEVSTGALLREQVELNANNSAVIKAQMLSGYVDDEIVYGLLDKHFSEIEIPKNLIFNATVRRGSQLNLFENLLKHNGIELDKVIFIDLDDETAIRRMLGRGRKTGRLDDNPQGIASRLSAFRLDIDKILTYYREVGKLIVVDGSGPIEEVHAQILLQLGLKR